MSLYHFAYALNQDMRIFQGYDYQSRRYEYRPRADAVIYKCPDCGRSYTLDGEIGVDILPGDLWFYHALRPCGLSDCAYIAERTRHLPCGLPSGVWGKCYGQNCYLRRKCAAYTPR